VKIRGTCKVCDREFLAEQVIESGGSCPWDGTPFAPDYAVTLVEALRDAETAGSQLERALGAIADVQPLFRLDPSSVTGNITASLERLSMNLIRQG
jgi:hypothetical protein